MARKRSTPIEPATDSRPTTPPGAGSAAAGSSGDMQGLPRSVDDGDVTDLAEEGQYYEAALEDGVENAPLADEGEVRVHQRSEDDLRPEYSDRDSDEPAEE